MIVLPFTIVLQVSKVYCHIDKVNIFHKDMNLLLKSIRKLKTESMIIDIACLKKIENRHKLSYIT